MGIIANIIAGLVGSTIGQAILGTWGPSLWDGYCAIDYRGSDFSCHRFMDFRTKIERFFRRVWAIVQTLFIFFNIIQFIKIRLNITFL